MNAIEGSLRYVKSRIDRRLLADAFLDNESRRLRGTQNVDSAIVEDVIREYVVRDLSTKGGKTFNIDLTNLSFEKLDQWTKVYKIPEERREGRDIVRAEFVARSIYAGSTTVVPNYFNQYGRRTGLAHQVEKMSLANQPVNQTMTADIEFLAPNVLAVRDFDLLHVSPVLKCKLALSPNLEEISEPYHSELHRLIFFAVRREIYTRLSLDLDMGKLEGGREFGAYGNALEAMADAADMYDEELEKWSKYLILIDKHSAQAVYRRSGN